MKPITAAILSAATFAAGLGLGMGGAWTGFTSAEPSAAVPSAPRPGSPVPGDEVLARVNGIPIFRSDVKLKLDTSGHETKASPESEKNLLEALISREVVAQRARAQGLDKDPEYLDDATKLGAQARGFERQALSELFLRREGARRGAPSEEDARAWFEANKQRVQTELHVYQILRRSEAQATEARNAIQGGKSFEEVAESLIPALPDGKKPWDLGFLSFSKVPEPWREWVYELEAGQTSGIIRGPNQRYWIVKVVEKRTNPDTTFESVREAVVADMGKNGQEAARAAVEAELRKSATIEYVAP